MRQKIWKQSRRLISALLAAVLLCACGIPRPAKTPTPASYEQYTEETLKIQEMFDKLTDQVFREEVVQSTINLHYSLADPAAYGITDAPITFGDYTLESMRQDMEKLKKLREQLDSIDCERLTEEQQLTYHILISYLETELSSEGMELYAQPFTPTIGVQAQLPVLLAEYPFYTRQDVDIYLELLSQIDVYYSQLMDFERQKAEAGLFMSDEAVDHVVESCEGYLIQPDHSFMAETFDSRVDALTDLTEEERQGYKARNLQILNDHFVPAYQNVREGLTALKGSGVNSKGICYFPSGKEVYQYMVKASTGTSYETVEDLKAAIGRKMSDDLSAMSQIMKEHPEVLELLDNYSFRYRDPNEILENLKSQLPKDFPELPPCSYTVKYVPQALQNALSPAFYLTPPLDRFQDNVIYINGGERFQSDDLYTTLAHEGYPGHLYQTVYFISHTKNNLRQLLSFPSYSEGWATYVEYYSYTLDNGLDPNLGALLAYNSSVTLALYAILDISINYEGWDRDQVSQYLSQYYSVDGTDVVDSIYSALVENPTNYLEYYVGSLEISNMRSTAEETLGDQFDLKSFHQFILDIGPAPFSVIRPYFNTWLVSGSR